MVENHVAPFHIFIICLVLLVWPHNGYVFLDQLSDGFLSEIRIRFVSDLQLADGSRSQVKQMPIFWKLGQGVRHLLASLHMKFANVQHFLVIARLPTAQPVYPRLCTRLPYIYLADLHVKGVGFIMFMIFIIINRGLRGAFVIFKVEYQNVSCNTFRLPSNFPKTWFWAASGTENFWTRPLTPCGR